MIISLRARAVPGSACAVGINGWSLKSAGDSALGVALTGRATILLARATGPADLARVAVDACIGEAGRPVDMLTAARARLAKEGRILDGVSVQLAAVVLTPERTGVIAVSGALPVYLISDGYAARVDPDVAASNRIAIRELVLTSRQQLLLADEPLEDQGIQLDWQPSAGGKAVEALVDQAAGFVVGVSVS